MYRWITLVLLVSACSARSSGHPIPRGVGDAGPPPGMDAGSVDASTMRPPRAPDDPCGAAEAGGSYIGCEYWAVPLTNAPSDHLYDAFDFRIAVANADTELARITVRRAGTVIETAEVAPGEVKEIVLPWIDALSRGITQVGGALDAPRAWDSLVVPDGAYHVTSDRPVVVYQFNPFHYMVGSTDLPRLSYSNDASLLLPAHVLGTDYQTASFEPLSFNYRDERLAGGRTPNGQPGYIAVVGTSETPAEVTIIPTAPVAAAEDGRFPATPAGGTIRFALSRGEVVVVAADVNPPCDESRPSFHVVEPSATSLAADEFCHERAYDLTGSTIASSLPVAAFGGHVCAFVPYDAWACDHLETQLPPTTTLGRDYVVTPLVDTDTDSPQNSSIRIIAVRGGTAVDVTSATGTDSFVLGAGEVRELSITEPHHVSASDGVLVTEYLVGQLSGGEKAERGDPAMLTIPPTEQFRADYVFVAPSSYDIVPTNPIYPQGQSFVAIIRPPGVEVTLDGARVETGWQPVGAFEVGIVPIVGGSHRMRSAAPFGLLVYGLGVHTSYAYPAGLDLEPILLI